MVKCLELVELKTFKKQSRLIFPYTYKQRKYCAVNLNPQKCMLNESLFNIFV